MKRVSPADPKAPTRRKTGFYAQRVVQRLGGRRITLYRRNDIADSSWFCCLYLREEKKQYRISLKTDDKNEAQRKAANLSSSTYWAESRMAKQCSRRHWKQVYQSYKEEQARLVEQEQIAHKTRLLQGYRIKLGLEFIKSQYPTGVSTKISALDGTLFREYLTWRRAKRAAKGAGKTIRLDVVRDELLSIRKMFLFARNQKLCAERNIPTWDFVVEKDSPKRRRVTQENYNGFLRCVKSWKSKAKNPKERYHREMLFHFALVVAHTGLRTGELMGLKNRDVQIREAVGKRIRRLTARCFSRQQFAIRPDNYVEV